MKPSFLQAFTDRIEKVMTIKTVYGDPIEREGRVIIPVAKVAFGVGGGGGTGAPAKAEIEVDGQEQEAVSGPAPEGEGGGGGGMVTPLGVLEITPEETVFIPISDTKRLMTAVGIGLLIGMWLGKKFK